MADVKTACSEQNLEAPRIQVYPYRWVILLLFCLSSMLNGFQWIHYSIISDVLQNYYDIPSYYVDWLSMIYMLVYIPLMFPASWLMDKTGLRLATILGAVGTCAGAWIKVMSISPDRFVVTFIGQVVSAVASVFILNVPSQLAAVWFGPNQVSSACAVGVFGNQFGVALGFLLPPMIVKNHDNISDISDDLKVMLYSLAGVTTVLVVFIILFFRNEPELPPSLAQANQRGARGGTSFISSIKRLAKNPGFVLMFLGYGIDVGVFNAISTLLNQVILSYFPGGGEDAGRIGLIIVIAGMVGSVLSGIVLDKTHRYKETTLGLYIFSLVGMLVFTFTLDTQIAVVYVISALLGFFMTGYLPVGFEFAVELTYPEPEATSSGLLTLSAQVLGIVLTMFYSWLLKIVDTMWANLALCGVLGVGAVLTACVSADYRRQKAQKPDEEQT